MPSRLLAFALAVFACLFAPTSALAVRPGKPITLVVPSAAGSTSDALARVLAPALSRALRGQIVLVENVVGAGGTVGSARVARANPDGLTLLLIDHSIATAPSLYRKLAFDPLRDFAPIGLVDEMPMLLVGRTNLPLRDRAELLAYLRNDRRRVTVADAGTGSASQLCALLLMSWLRHELGTASYKGSPPALTDLINGRVDLLCDVASHTMHAVHKRRVRPLAVASGRRVSLMPGIPSLEELGFHDFEMTAWHVLLAPRALPNSVVDKLQSALQTALNDPGLKADLAALGSTPVAPTQATASAAQTRIAAELSKWSPIIYKAGLVAD